MESIWYYDHLWNQYRNQPIICRKINQNLKTIEYYYNQLQNIFKYNIWLFSATSNGTGNSNL